MRNHISNAYDVYLEIRRRIDARLAMKLGRDTPNWRLHNACPACTYKLEDETPLEFSMLMTIDGNNSAKRMERQRTEKDENGNIVNTINVERANNYSIETDLYLTAEQVDVFKNEVQYRKEALAEPTTLDKGATPVDGVEKLTPCVDRWKNLAKEYQKKVLGPFHQTGIFTAACRHGVLLVMCDMIRSGEL